MSLRFNPEKRSARVLLWITAAIVFPAMLLAGYVTVTKNCYNAMNETPMTVFSVAKTDTGETAVVFLNKVIYTK